MKLIQLEDYLLLIDEESEIKEWDYYYDLESKLVPIKQSIENSHKDFKSYKIIAYYPLKEAKELDLPLLPKPFEEEVDVEKLACNIYNLSLDEYEYINEDLSQNRSLIEEHYKGINREEIAERYFDVISFIAGYNAGQKSNKQYSLEDMIAFSEYVGSYYANIHNPVIPTEELLNNFIQSLSTQQLPVSFEPEYKNHIKTNNDIGHVFIEPKLKTITNSEGKEELVGTYKY